MRAVAACAALLLLLHAAAGTAPPPTPAPPPAGGAGFLPKGALRGFHVTPRGALHYVYNLPAGKPVMVLLHGDPRSAGEFTQLLTGVGGMHPDYGYIAVDFYGMGCSDDIPDEGDCEDPCISAQDYAGHVMAIAEKVLPFQAKFHMVGNLKGSYPAIYVAAKYGDHVLSLTIANTLYLFPGPEAKVRHYAELSRNPAINADGSHILGPYGVWFNPSDGPGIDANETDPFLIELNNRKTTDTLRSLKTHWQYEFMGLNYNPSFLADLRKVTCPALLLWGDAATANRDSPFLQLNGTESNALTEEALRANPPAPTVRNVPSGQEGMFEANATVVASHLRDFLTSI